MFCIFFILLFIIPHNKFVFCKSPSYQQNRYLHALSPAMLYNLFTAFNSLNAELNLICHLLAIIAHHILHVSRIRVKYRNAICHSYFSWLVVILRVKRSVCNNGKGKGIPVHAMKAQREWKYSSILHNLSTRCRWVASLMPGHSSDHAETSGIHWIGAWEDTRTSLDILKRTLLACLSIEPWIILPVAQSLWQSYAGSFLPKTNSNSWDS